MYIQIFGDSERLTLCEVEVEGHAPSGNAPFDFLKMNQYQFLFTYLKSNKISYP